MILLATSLMALFTAAAADMAPVVVQAPDSPVRLDHAKILNVGAAEPAVLLYAATNLTDVELEQFTVIAFIFDAEGVLKTRQLAPGRRTLEKRGTKYLHDGARRPGGDGDRPCRRRRQPGPANRFRQVVVRGPRSGGKGSGQEITT